MSKLGKRHGRFMGVDVVFICWSGKEPADRSYRNRVRGNRRFRWLAYGKRLDW
jgi:hypothetical protein